MNNYSTIPGMLRDVVMKNPDKNLINYKYNNKWVSINGLDTYKTICNITSSIRSCGLFENSKIAILSSTSYKWALCDYGILCNNSVTVTVYPTLIASQIEYILNNSEAELIFVENQEQLDKILSIKDNCPSLKLIVKLDNDIGVYISGFVNNPGKSKYLLLKELEVIIENIKINKERK